MKISKSDFVRIWRSKMQEEKTGLFGSLPPKKNFLAPIVLDPPKQIEETKDRKRGAWLRNNFLPPSSKTTGTGPTNNVFTVS
jgi:hypothetical protein